MTEFPQIQNSANGLREDNTRNQTGYLKCKRAPCLDIIKRKNNFLLRNVGGIPNSTMGFDLDAVYFFGREIPIIIIMQWKMHGKWRVKFPRRGAQKHIVKGIFAPVNLGLGSSISTPWKMINRRWTAIRRRQKQNSRVSRRERSLY